MIINNQKSETPYRKEEKKKKEREKEKQKEKKRKKKMKLIPKNKTFVENSKQ
jgi:hypothetical protein